MLDDPQRLIAERLRLHRELAQPRRFRVVEVGKRETRQDQSETHLSRPPHHSASGLLSADRQPRETAMTEFSYDHVHLRSPDPDETAAYYERMFGAEIIKSVMSNGIERTDMNLGGVMVFIAQVPADSGLAEKPKGSFVGLDHLGLRVRGIDRVCEELKAKGAEFTVEPTR